MKSKILIIGMILMMLLLMGCAKTVEELTTSDKYVDKSVSVKGTAENSIKIGGLSGYTLVDKNGDKIAVSTDNLPKEGEKVTAKGTLKKGPLGLAFYIDEK